MITKVKVYIPKPLEYAIKLQSASEKMLRGEKQLVLKFKNRHSQGQFINSGSLGSGEVHSTEELKCRSRLLFPGRLELGGTCQSFLGV